MAYYLVNIDPNSKPNFQPYASQAGFWFANVDNQLFIDAEDQAEADVKIAALEAFHAAFDHVAAAKAESMGRLKEETATRLTALESDAEQTMLHTAVLQKLIANAGTAVNQWPQGDQDELSDLRDRLDAIDALAAAADVIAADINAQNDFWDAYSYDIAGSSYWPSV